MKESRKIAEGLAPLETVIFLDSEGMQCPSIAFRSITLTCKVNTSFSSIDGRSSSMTALQCVPITLNAPYLAAATYGLFE